MKSEVLKLIRTTTFFALIMSIVGCGVKGATAIPKITLTNTSSSTNVLPQEIIDLYATTLCAHAGEDAKVVFGQIGERDTEYITPLKCNLNNINIHLFDPADPSKDPYLNGHPEHIARAEQNQGGVNHTAFTLASPDEAGTTHSFVAGTDDPIHNSNTFPICI
jgi:hypothetical protein